MKGIIIYSDVLIRILTFGGSWLGIARFPFIILRSSYKVNPDMGIINHERIHLYQQAECLILIWWFIWVIEVIFKSLYYRSFSKVYYSLSFEREAYSNQDNSSYLDNRKWFSFIKYIYMKEE